MANTTGKKFGGRKAGTPNKTSQEMREFIQAFLEFHIDNLDEIFEKLKPRDKMSVIIKMLPYILPKHMVMDVTATHGEPEPSINLDLSKLSDSALEEIEALYHQKKE